MWVLLCATGIPTPRKPRHWATELLVEARGSGTCVVRLVSGFFTAGDGWEKHLEGTDEGSSAGMRNLRLAMTHFRGQAAASMMAVGTVADRHPDHVSREVLRALRLDGAALGASIRLGGDLPDTSGTIVDAGRRSVTLRTGEPHPGILEFATFDHGGTSVVVRGYLTGRGATESRPGRHRGGRTG